MCSVFIRPSSVADPDPGSGAFLTPVSRMGKTSKSRSGIRIQDEHLKSYFWEFSNNFLGLKYLIFYADPDPGAGILKFWPWIRDGQNLDPG